MPSSVRTAVIALTCALLGVTAGLYLGGHPTSLPGPIKEAFVEDERASVRAELIESIDDNFFKEVDRSKLEDASLNGIIESLDDRFSHYFNPEQSKLFEQSVSGAFEGVGLSVDDEEKRGLLVVTVFDGSPAKKAGIRKGDIVTEVNGESIAGEPSDVATGKIKGKAGTKVRLTLLDPVEEKTREVEVERARIELPIVRAEMVERDGRKLGIARFATFSRGSHGELRTEIDDLLEKGAEGIVLDLRGNGGGLLEEAQLVSSIFIEDGVVVSTKGRTRSERKLEAKGDAIDGDVPVVVLVDHGSASASEIVTGALRDYDRGTVVGTRTFGKGVFQEVEPLSNGGTLSLTVGSYFLPKGDNIADKGIQPEVPALDKPRTERDEAEPVALDTLIEEIEGEAR